MVHWLLGLAASFPVSGRAGAATAQEEEVPLVVARIIEQAEGEDRVSDLEEAVAGEVVVEGEAVEGRRRSERLRKLLQILLNLRPSPNSRPSRMSSKMRLLTLMTPQLCLKMRMTMTTPT